MKIKVTPKHIVKGFEESVTHCPIALALKDALDIDDNDTLDTVRVTVELLHVWKGGTRRTYKVTGVMERFILRFDEGLSVKPKTFEVRECFWP